MKDEIKQNKFARYSLYIGLSAAMWWIIIFFHPEGIGNFYIAVSAMVQHAIGLILGIAGLRKKIEKKYAAFGIGINASFILIALLFVLAPLLVESTGLKHVPDEKEIRARFGEFLVEPHDIQGISSFGKEGNTIFKYHTRSNNFMPELEQKATAKGWIEEKINDSTVDFEKDNHETRNGEIVLYKYGRLRVVHNNATGIVCVGYGDIVSLDKVTDFENNVDMKAIRFTTWSRLDLCAAEK